LSTFLKVSGLKIKVLIFFFKEKKKKEAPLKTPSKLGATSKEETYPLPTELEKALNDPVDYGLNLDL